MVYAVAGLVRVTLERGIKCKQSTEKTIVLVFLQVSG